LAIVVPRRSWLEISLRETGKGRKKEKGARKEGKKEGKKERRKEGKKRKDIQTAELDRRDQVTATVPGPVPFERGEQRSITR
jgi:hypothetical protein